MDIITASQQYYLHMKRNSRPQHEEEKDPGWTMRGGSSEPFPPPFVVVGGGRKVSIDKRVEVLYFDPPRDIDPEKLWYSESDISRFMDKKDAKTPEWGTSGARVYNHMRRILFHYKAMKQTGSIDPNKLCKLSEDSSKRAKAKALKSAATVAKSVQCDPSVFSVFGSRSRVVDFYMESILDKFNDTGFKLCRSM